MNRQIAHQTTLAIHILVKDDTGALVFSVCLVTKLFFLLWQANRFLSSTKHELAMLISEAKSAIEFTGTVLTICLSSLAYGLRMKR